MSRAAIVEKLAKRYKSVIDNILGDSSLGDVAAIVEAGGIFEYAKTAGMLE